MRNILLLLMIFSLQFIALTQIDIKLNFEGNKKEMRNTIKLLNKFDFYIIIENKEVRLDFVDNCLFRIENLTEDQLSYLKEYQNFVLKAYRKKLCYYFPFYNDFSNNRAVYFTFYDGTIKKILVRKKKKVYVIRFAFNISNTNSLRFRNFPSIPCSKYKGEYDNGIEEYLNRYTNE